MTTSTEPIAPAPVLTGEDLLEGFRTIALTNQEFDQAWFSPYESEKQVGDLFYGATKEGQRYTTVEEVPTAMIVAAGQIAVAHHFSSVELNRLDINCTLARQNLERLMRTNQGARIRVTLLSELPEVLNENEPLFLLNYGARNDLSERHCAKLATQGLEGALTNESYRRGISPHTDELLVKPTRLLHKVLYSEMYGFRVFDIDLNPLIKIDVTKQSDGSS